MGHYDEQREESLQEALEETKRLVRGSLNTEIDVSVLKHGDQYFNESEGWLTVDRVEKDGKFWKIWDTGSEWLRVSIGGADADGHPQWNITKVVIAERNLPCETNKPITSDGGSSDYYKLPSSIVEKVVQTSELQTEDIILHVFDNDFDFGNIFKTLVRLHGLSKGAGKAGNTASYECNKIIYSIKKIDKRLSHATINTPTTGATQ